MADQNSSTGDIAEFIKCMEEIKGVIWANSKRNCCTVHDKICTVVDQTKVDICGEICPFSFSKPYGDNSCTLRVAVSRFNKCRKSILAELEEDPRKTVKTVDEIKRYLHMQDPNFLEVIESDP